MGASQHHAHCHRDTPWHGEWACCQCWYYISCPTEASLECHLLIELIEGILGQGRIRLEYCSAESYTIVVLVDQDRNQDRVIRIFSWDPLLGMYGTGAYRVEYLGQFQLYDTNSFSDLVKYLRRLLADLSAFVGRS